jgi:hypothetical protein
MHTAQRSSAPARPSHPILRDLVGGIDVGSGTLGKRPDAASLVGMMQMLANADYWLSFEVASFEPLLARTPSPLRELGVAIALRFGDGVDGMLQAGDLLRGREALLAMVPADIKGGVERGLETLMNAVEARDRLPALEEAGFRRYAAGQSLSVHALRAMGRSNISVAGYPDDEKRIEVKLGSELVLTATDEKGRPLPVPEIESHLEAPLYSKDDPALNRRTIYLFVPGEYHVRVPGRAAGDRRIFAR